MRDFYELFDIVSKKTGRILEHVVERKLQQANFKKPIAETQLLKANSTKQIAQSKSFKANFTKPMPQIKL